MAAPTPGNAWERIVAILVIPAIPLVFAIPITHAVYGSIHAGILLNVYSLVVLVGIAGAATFWNIPYHGTIAIGGTVLYSIAPSVFEPFVHSALSTLNSVIVLLWIIYIWVSLFGKLGLDIGGSGR